jgi:hypothetical protein
MEILFVLSFILTGCGIDSLFASEESMWTWIITALVAVISGFIVFGNRHDDKRWED